MKNPMDMFGQHILITGAASGIGRATSILLSELGADLVLCDKNEEELLLTLAQCKKTDLILTLDITNEKLLKENIYETVKKTGRLTGFAHIAGCPCIAPLKVIQKNVCDEIFHINTYVGLQLAQIFFNNRIRNTEIDCGNSIVYISSIYANVGSAANAVYAMSKGAIQSMTKALAIELASKNIRVNCVSPGFTNTNMGKDIDKYFDNNHNNTVSLHAPLGLGEPEDIANMIVFLLSSASKYCTGGIYPVDGGFTAQ